MNTPRMRIYFVLGFLLLCLLSLTTKASEKIRSGATALVAPLWHSLKGTKGEKGNGISAIAYEQVVHENRHLRVEIHEIKEMVRREIALLEELKQLGVVAHDDVDPIKTRYWHRFNLLLQLKALPAEIIYRSAAFWDESCWINVGTETNAALGVSIVAKNSPVVIGNAIVGVVDEVGAKRSRVRLVTDAGLVPSVRVMRKTESGEELYLAKGEIHGCGQPLWRTHGHQLKGVGFNSDFSDDLSPSRDLRTGVESNKKSGGVPVPIICKGDLLVTTGMDGVFPKGFHVATVTHVYPLKEGDYYYEIDAAPVVGNLDEIADVFVLPSLEEL